MGRWAEIASIMICRVLVGGPRRERAPATEAQNVGTLPWHELVAISERMHPRKCVLEAAVCERLNSRPIPPGPELHQVISRPVTPVPAKTASEHFVPPGGMRFSLKGRSTTVMNSPSCYYSTTVLHYS